MSELTLDPLKLRKRLDEASLYLRIEEIVDRRTELEDLVAQPNFWDDIELAKKLSRELAEITEDIQLFHGLAANIDDAETLLELSQEEGDQATIEEAGILLTEADKAFDDLELRSLFTGEHDERDRKSVV